jgi:superkiller protein 3
VGPRYVHPHPTILHLISLFYFISQLPALYNEIINHPNTSDILRRDTESKLLKHRQMYLHALPPGSEKVKIAKEVDELVNGVIVLGIPNELAWGIFLESKDCDTIG